ncbi:MAG: M23 family metallopeptidase [Ruminococcaceae bacterium]|nr:M23 family metallopeptidase [Oscillospiraceae bacterium]
MKKYKHKSAKKPTERVGFYIALSICLVAVGLAVYSTYTSVSEYLKKSDDEYYSSLVEETVPVVQDVTGITEEETEYFDATLDEVPQETRERSYTLYETSTIPPTADVDASADLDSLSAVLKVTESLIYPVDSKSVLREYSEVAVYNSTMKDYRAHTGTDFVAKEGEKVYSMCDGVVNSISFDERYGVIVEVSNSNYSVYYCGVDSKTNVKMKDQVRQGDVIGTVSQIPCEKSDPTHLHVEIKVGDKLIDPLTVILSDR